MVGGGLSFDSPDPGNGIVDAKVFDHRRNDHASATRATCWQITETISNIQICELCPNWSILSEKLKIIV